MIYCPARGEKGLITIDTTKIANKAMVKAFADITGMQTLAIPDKIDRETYQTLVDLKEGPKRDAYLASIKPRLSKASYKAAVQRLDDVIAQRRMAQAGRRHRPVVDYAMRFLSRRGTRGCIAVRFLVKYQI